MNQRMMIKPYIQIGMLLCMIPLMGFSNQKKVSDHFEESAPQSLADHLHLKKSKDPIDGGWLANLSGLPDTSELPALTQKVVDIMKSSKDARCSSVDSRLRTMIFQHFAIYQRMVNAQGIELDESIAHRWAHVLGMLLKESSGDSASITDMHGHSISTYSPYTDLEHWKKILGLKKGGPISFNYQTNFGLLQTSSDRLFAAFKLAQNQEHDTEYLEGIEGANTPGKITLNTAIAIRRLIWFYQDFAQGRLSESDQRIHRQDINKPEFSARYDQGLDAALLYCGTPYLFKEGYQQHNIDELKSAMSSISYCKLGNYESGYGMTPIDEQCFAQWVTLCPALNIDIATLTPDSYFATRGEAPICEDVFNQMIREKP